MIFTAESLYATLEPGDYARTLASLHGEGRYFGPVPCWAIVDDRPVAVDVVIVRGHCDNRDSCHDYAETVNGRVLSSRYLFPRRPLNRKPIMAELKDDYGVYHDWVSEGRRRPRR